jgi:hypothetical protein
VVVDQQDAVEAMAYYIALYISAMPEAQRLEPKQLQAALKEGFKVRADSPPPLSLLSPLRPQSVPQGAAVCLRRSRQLTSLLHAAGIPNCHRLHLFGVALLHSRWGLHIGPSPPTPHQHTT